MNAERPLAWVTGAGGLIGNYVVAAAPLCAPEWEVAGLTRDRLDLLDFAAVRRKFLDRKPQLVIHCAGLTRSHICQADLALARRLNVDLTRLLAELCSEGTLLFMSTDLVFDGSRGNYDESAPVNPLGVYAETKAEAEQCVLTYPRHIVVRTSLNGGTSPTGDRGFNEEMRRAWAAGRTLRLFTDEYRSPMPAEVLARSLWEIVLKGSPGIYHVAGSERLSRWQIGQVVAARWPQLNPRISPSSLEEYAGPPRPPDTTLDCGRAQALLSFPLPGLTRWLADHPERPF